MTRRERGTLLALRPLVAKLVPAYPKLQSTVECIDSVMDGARGCPICCGAMDIDSTKNADYVNGRWVHTTCAPYVPNGAGVAEPRSLDVIFRRLHDPEDELVRLMRASLGDGNHMVWHKETRAKPWERRGSANATLPADDGVYGLRTTQLVRA